MLIECNFRTYCSLTHSSDTFRQKCQQLTERQIEVADEMRIAGPR